MEHSIFMEICFSIVRFYCFLVLYIESTYDDIYVIDYGLESDDSVKVAADVLVATQVATLSKNSVLYDAKYLDEFHKMKLDAIFTSSSENRALWDTECKLLLQKMTDQKEIICNWNDDDTKTNLNNETRDYIAETFNKPEYVIQSADETYSDSDSESDSKSHSENESKSEDKDDSFEHVSNTCTIDSVCYNVDKISPILKEKLENLNAEIANYPSPELLLLAQNTVCETILDKRLVNSFIMDATPVGNVILRYNATKTTFEYFSDKTVPRRFLETLARKYVVAFHCPHLYVDTEAEIAKSEDAVKNAVKNAVYTSSDIIITASLDKDSVKAKSKQIFAKLKPYNAKPSGRSATTAKSIMAMKGRSKESTSPFQFKLKNGDETKESKVMLDQSNSFTYMDRLSGFNPLQNKVVDKKASMTFAEYKASLLV